MQGLNIEYAGHTHMKRILCLSIYLFSLNCYANIKEINHLLEFVSLTECVYERNGERHTGKEAAKHIQKKYDYYQDDIKSTEDFIDLAATKSSVSGKPYRVICPDKQAISSKIWLTTELLAFRNVQ